MGTLLFFFKEAVRGFYQAKLMTFVSIVSIAVALCIVNMIVIAFFNIETLLRKGMDQADIAAYISETASVDDESFAKLRARVDALPGVRSAILIDKDSAWKRFAEIYGNEMLDAVEDNPLPASLEIRLDDASRSPQDAQRVADAVSANPEIESVRYSSEWIRLVERFRFTFWVVVVVIGAVMNFILYFMIANTIKLTIYARKDLIAHMQVVGATALFIKMPFLLEGILQGVIGGILCMVAIAALQVPLHRIPIFWGPSSLPYIIILVGVAYGLLGSAGAVRKFLS